jgi:hypothetical protein
MGEDLRKVGESLAARTAKLKEGFGAFVEVLRR